MTLRVAVVGTGVIGRLRAQTIQAHPQCTLAAVVDPDPDAAARAAKGSSAAMLQDMDDVWDRDIDAIVVASPLPVHEEQVGAALERGVHVLCEKPLANSVDGSRRLVAAADAHGATLAVGFNHRFYPSISFMKRVLDEGRIGTIDHFRVFGAHDGLANFKADWQYRAPASGGGALMDVGIHMTDLARYLAGDIAEVFGYATEGVWQVPGSEDNVVAVLRTASGVPISYQATWNEWRGYRFYVDAYGDRGMVRGYYAPMFNLLITQSRPGGRRTVRRKFYPEIIVREKLLSWESTTRQSFVLELEGFLAQIRGETAATATGVDGLRAVEIADAVKRSQERGAAVRMLDEARA